ASRGANLSGIPGEQLPMRHGFTIRDLIATVCALVVIGAICAAWMFRGRGESRRHRDETQLRGLGQSLVTWCQGNNDDYPLPSRVDKANYTLTLEGRAKDTTSNIYSMLVFNG